LRAKAAAHNNKDQRGTLLQNLRADPIKRKILLILSYHAYGAQDKIVCIAGDEIPFPLFFLAFGRATVYKGKPLSSLGFVLWSPYEIGLAPELSGFTAALK